MGLEFVKIDLDKFIVVGRGVSVDFGVGAQVGLDGLGGLGDLGAIGGFEVADHGSVKGEKRSGRTNFGAHITNGAFAGAGHVFGAFAEVLDNGAGAALDGENAGDLEDDIFGGGPAAEFAFKMDADEFGKFEFPGHAGHDIDGVGAADADRDHTEAAGVGGVGVGADHHAAGEGVVFEDDLVDDAGAGFPEAEAVFIGDGGEKVVDLLVHIEGGGEIGAGAGFRGDEVIAMDRRGHGGLGLTRLHELEEGHLSGGVLHGDPIGGEIDIVPAALVRLLGGAVPEVVIKDFFRQREGASEELSGGLDATAHAIVDRLNHVIVKSHGVTFFVSGCIRRLRCRMDTRSLIPEYEKHAPLFLFLTRAYKKRAVFGK